MGAASFSRGDGGIAAVSRLCWRALLESEFEPARCSLLANSKPLFAVRCHAAAWTRTHFVYDSAGLARAHPMVSGLPYATWMHGIEAWEGLRSDRAHALSRAGLVIANSRYTLARYSDLHSNLASAEICHPATEEDEPAPPRLDSPWPPTVLILARIDRTEGYKGHQALLACWSQVVAAVPSARLLIAGGGSGLPSLRAEVAASPVADRIEVLGYVPQSDIDAIWRRAGIFAMPSRGEGFGLVYAEAMRRGLPVIASVHDAGAEVNADGVTGYNVNLDRKDELPGRLIDLLRNPALASALGQNGLRLWRKQYSYSAFKNRFLPIVRTWISRSS